MIINDIKILGEIPVKKNRQRISRYGGIYKDPGVRAFEDRISLQIKNRINKKELQPIMGEFKLSGAFFILTRKDIDGALTTILDALQLSGLIKNDRFLVEIQNLYKHNVKNIKDEEAYIKIEEL